MDLLRGLSDYCHIMLFADDTNWALQENVENLSVMNITNGTVTKIIPSDTVVNNVIGGFSRQ